MQALSHLLRPDIAALEAYTPIVPLEVLAQRLGIPLEQLVKLDANENPYGPSPRALAALAAAGQQVPNRYAIYPDPDHTALRAALSSYTGQPATRIICGAGSDELIDLLMRACLQPGETLIDCPPTFGMYRFDAGLHAAQVRDVPRDTNFDLDLEAVADAAEQHAAKMLFVAVPNNPTGNPLPRQAVLRLLELPLLLVIDEAYAEFAGESVADLAGSVPNLVVLRTFSKWAGLAGLRVGYALAHEDLLAQLWKIKQPYSVNVAAEIAALASLEDLDERMQTVRQIVSERERMFGALRRLPGLHVFPSQGNFLLCRVAEADQRPTTNDQTMRIAAAASAQPAPVARQIKEALAGRGILLRYFNKPGLRDCIRISIGTPAQNDTLLQALAEEVAVRGQGSGVRQ